MTCHTVTKANDGVAVVLNLVSPLKLLLDARQDLAGVQHRVAVLVGGNALHEEASLYSSEEGSFSQIG